MKSTLRNSILLALSLSALAFAALNGSLDEARRSYTRTDYAEAIRRLAGATDAPSLRLLGQSYLMSGDFKKASDTLDRAIALDPQNSEGYLLLGRAYGHRAENAFAVAAPALAIKARQNLERAVAADPQNWDAVDDLFEYYLEAPGFLGGGSAKALKLADRIATRDPAEAASDRARVAESRKDFTSAEAGFRRAVALAPRQPSRLIDLARFLARRSRYAESDQAFSQALAAEPPAPRFLYSRADTLIQANRNLPEARQLLKTYLSMNLTPDDPPREQAQKLLRKASTD